MRDPNRIDKFMDELKEIWKTQCPDWRFTQLITNVLSNRPENIWFAEEDRAIEYFREYFEIDKKEE